MGGAIVGWTSLSLLEGGPRGAGQKTPTLLGVVFLSPCLTYG